MLKNTLSEFRKLLNDVEDYFSSGFREDHPEILQDGESAFARPQESTPSQGSASTRPQESTPSRERVQEAARESGPIPGLEQIAREVSQCTLCALCRKRIRAVPGEGSPRPLVLIVGEGPGAEEDNTGRPFVGPAGRYLDRWLDAVKVGKGNVSLSRERNVFIANVVKCRPPGNRDPLPEEIDTCIPYLERQMDLLKPKALLTLGRIALHTLTRTSGSLGSLRGRQYVYRDVPLIPTYHPSAVLREIAVAGKQAPMRSRVWEDLKRLKALLENEAFR